MGGFFLPEREGCGVGGWLGFVADGEGVGEGLVSGVALFEAFDPRNFGGEFERAGFQIGCEVERHEQDGFVRVDVGGQAVGDNFFGGGPLDFPSGDAGRQQPLDFCGLPGVLRVGRVGVPAVAHLQVDAGEDGIAGARGVGGEEELCVRVRGVGVEAECDQEDGC